MVGLHGRDSEGMSPALALRMGDAITVMVMPETQVAQPLLDDGLAGHVTAALEKRHLRG